MENIKEKKSIIKFLERRNKFAIDPTTLSMLGFSSGDYFFEKRIGDGLLTIGVFFNQNVDIFWEPMFYSGVSKEEVKKTSTVLRKVHIKNLRHFLNLLHKTIGNVFKI